MVWNLPYGMDESHPDCVELKLAITEKIWNLYNSGISCFFCNCEYGLPLWAAEAIVGMRLLKRRSAKINLIIPHENQAAVWSNEVRERYYNINAAADSVVILSTKYKEDCYRKADEFMIDHSIMLLTDGGNEYISEYAKSKNKDIEPIKMLINR
jgi:uncharacterized phage-like protein YoqJ